MTRYLSILFLLLVGTSFVWAQQGELQGKVTDAASGETIPFANIAITVNGSLSGTQSDFDGFYSIKPIPPGSYDVQISYVGYQKKIIESVLVSSDQITFLNVELNEESELLEEFEIVSYKVPLLKADETSTGSTVTKEDIANLPTRNVSSIAAQSSGVFQSDEGGALNVKGSRSDATDYYIDGIKVRGSNNLPASAIEQMTVVTGGVPARYGDATGGIINITTRGPSNQIAGGFELVTSKFLDDFGYYLANFNLSSPLLKIKKNTPEQRTIMGFFISGEYLHEDDDDPSSLGIYTVNEETRRLIEESPLIRSNTSSGFIQQVALVTDEDIINEGAKRNIEKDQISIAGKIDIQPVTNINVTVGGSLNYKQGGMLNSGLRDFNRRFQMFNPTHTPRQTFNDWRVYARFTQRFGNNKVEVEDEGSVSKASWLQNAYYSVQFDYSKSYFTRDDPNFEDNYFDYGYVGKFDTYRQPVYGIGQVGNLQGWEFLGYQDTLVTFEASDIAPFKSNHTAQYFELAGDDRASFYSNRDQILLNGGLLNGNVPASLSGSYSLYNVPGTVLDQYWKTEDDQYRLTFNGSFDMKKPGKSEVSKHAIEFGFEYEQRIDREWILNPVGLWNVMDQRIARFGSDIVRDLDNPILIIDGEEIALEDYDGETSTFSTNDTITYDLVRSGEQSFFDSQFRDRFNYGLLDLVDVFSANPNDLSLDMFSPEELYNGGGGASLVSYHGYDAYGNKLTSQPAFNDFWTAEDQYGNKSRPVGSFQPIYMAGFIQDKFSFKDLIFNIGVRVDRFDANQKVPKDIFSPLYATHKAGDQKVVDQFGNAPSTIGEDYVVYVDNEVNPTAVLGYRDGEQWYDSDGAAITDASVLEAGGSVSPYLSAPLSSNPKDDIKDESYNPDLAFEDYKPQISVMPRIAFSFSISDEAIFFAHYDVLTQRPQDRLVTTPYDYYYFAENSLFGVINNSNLKPETTVDYQIGFKQKLNSSSALTISGFYRDLRDMVQVTSIPFAYPSTYSTYGNRDFGTVKGFEIAYDMRRTSNLRMTINYTLQFAEGTGSGDRSQVNLIDFGVPNLRNIIPLTYDSRHMINVNADYRFGEGKDYNGPKIKGKDFLANFGANLTLSARTGTPFTRQKQSTPDAQYGVRARGTLDGTINGSRLPANFTANLRIDKDFNLNFSKKEGKRDKYINVYFLIQNLFNTDNVVGVYEFTGSPDDDGYVNSPTGQEITEGQIDQTAFVDQYTVKAQDPNHFSIPRRMRLGLMFNF